MDISSLLSPQDSASDSDRRSSPAAAVQSNGNAQGSRLPNQPVPSPLHHVQSYHKPLLPAGSTHHPVPSPSLINSPHASTTSHHSYGSTASAPEPVLHHRPSSTPGMDTLADLASMQHHQQSVRKSSHILRNRDVLDIQRSASSPTVPTLYKNRQSSTSVAELAMNDTPTTVPRTFVAPSLSKTDLQQINTLTSELAENSYLYNTHVSLLNLLHQGFIAHVYPSNAPGPIGEPSQYNLLADLRQARQAMNSRYPVGEDLWIDWIKDEAMLARTVEDRIAVMELCTKAVEDEVGSSRLWRLYGDWMWHLHFKSIDQTEETEDNWFDEDGLVRKVLQQHPWTEQDKAIGKEVFNWEAMLGAWEGGIAATRWHLNDSNLVWDRYMAALTWGLASRRSAQSVQYIRDLYFDRLRQPHATWEDTCRNFSQFITNFDRDTYEETMVAVTKQGAAVKELYAQREHIENQLQRAIDVGDKDLEWSTITEYMEWELAQSRRKTAVRSDFQLVLGLSERANLLFPADADLWEDHLDLLMNNSNLDQASLRVATRATKHCPWSGSLWSKQLIILEACEKDFGEIEEIKHLATRTGLLEVGGLEELIKVYAAWCGYLRRRAFQPGASEDDRDIAEVAIRSSIDDIKNIGEKKYGKEFKGDPLFRVEKIYLKFLTANRNFDEARKVWQQLTVQHGEQYEFWDRYYVWEMVTWGREQPGSAHKDAESRSPPEYATAVLQKAIRRPNLDWPEKMIELYVHHCGQHESVSKMKEALVEARRMSKQVAKRRARERAEAEAEAQKLQQEQQVHAMPAGNLFREDNHVSKRKRDNDAGSDGEVSPKRLKEAADAAAASPAPSSAPVKRDRENTTIIVKNLPKDCTEVRVRRFFGDCGKILSLSMSADDESTSTTAMIEFESKEDVMSAQTKNYKLFDGQEIRIQVGTGTTLWVTNYSPTADEAYIQDLFKDFGTVTDVRFPSLKLNTHRRFCYVQFLTAAEAQAATALDGKSLAGGFTLTAKISDPLAKRERTGALQEGREVYVGNVDWNASEDEVRAFFASNGTIESVRIPRNLAGKSKGTAFIVFSTKDEADTAVSNMNMKEFKSRILKVTNAVPNATGAKRQATTIMASASPEPSEGINGASPAAEQSANADKTYRERTLALLDVPDTVNDARITALMSQYGALKKVSLRPDHQGAIVEFESIADVGKASLAVAGFEIVPGRFIRVGTVPELMKSASENKNTAPSAAGSKAKRTPDAAKLPPTAPVRRPNQPGMGARRGGRGGLGQKSAGGVLRREPTNGVPANAKSNTDFKSMMNS